MFTPLKVFLVLTLCMEGISILVRNRLFVRTGLRGNIAFKVNLRSPVLLFRCHVSGFSLRDGFYSDHGIPRREDFEKMESQKKELDDAVPDWLSRSDEEVVHKADDPGVLGNLSETHGTSLFDMLYNSEIDMDSTTSNSFAAQTLRDISDDYGFSLSFLGDYVVELGCYPPIDIDAKLKNMLTGAQIYSLMECVNTLDPYDSTIEYDSLSLKEVAEEMNISVTHAVKICQREGFNLPFGPDSILHVSIVDKFRDICEFGGAGEEGEADAIDVDIEDGLEDDQTVFRIGGDDVQY